MRGNSSADALPKNVLRAPGPEPRLALVSDSARAHQPCVPHWITDSKRPQLVEHVRKRVGDLIQSVTDGRVYEAIEEFYAPDVRLSQGAMAPMFCLDPKLARGRGSHRDLVWERFSADGVGVNGDTSFVECELEFSAADGGRFIRRYVSIAQWRDGRIVRESLQGVG